MRVHTIHVDTKPGEWHYLTPISDAHLDANNCDVAALQRLLAERDELPNHHLIALGDVGNWIVPKDVRRYQPAVAVDKVRGVDAYINAALDYQREVLGGYSWDLLCYGNHETALLQHHGVDVVRLLAERIGAEVGGYCGYLRYRMHYGSNRDSRSFVVVYHHGAWGGRVVKGFSGFRDWLRHHEGWDAALAGHNHHSVAHREARLAPSQLGEHAWARDVVIAFCGTHQRSLVDDAASGPTYDEIKGYAPTAIGAPLLQWRLVASSKPQIRAGAPRYQIEQRITL